MTGAAAAVLDLADLGFEQGAHLLVRRALAQLPPGGRLRIMGRDPLLPVHLAAWCRGEGHALDPDTGLVRYGRRDLDRWAGAQRAGAPATGGIVARPAP
ncbi:MAG TPA: ferritin-like domain-containing protein, partial [Pseudonocardiaceae bacterium]|nr:ferritin-like domain-containing protein [Pseudonocardiaceae bacterium]